MSFLLAPILTITAGALTASDFVVFPPQGITLRWYLSIFDQPEFLNSLWLSLLVAAAAATTATVIGLMVAIALVRYPSRFDRLLWASVLSPVMFPTVVLGLAFLEFYRMLGLGNSPWSLLAGHVVIVTPFATSLAVIGVEGANPQLELAAKSLGADSWRTLRYVTLPLVFWSLAAGWALSFMMSFGDLSVSLFLASPHLITLPVRIYSALELLPLDPSLTAIASGLVLVALIVLVAVSRFFRFEELLRTQ
ncbi:MAG: ABC transporter permease [Dehalococcoidia bacterium]